MYSIFNCSLAEVRSRTQNRFTDAMCRAKLLVPFAAVYTAHYDEPSSLLLCAGSFFALLAGRLAPPYPFFAQVPAGDVRIHILSPRWQLLGLGALRLERRGPRVTRWCSTQVAQSRYRQFRHLLPPPRQSLRRQPRRPTPDSFSTTAPTARSRIRGPINISRSRSTPRAGSSPATPQSSTTSRSWAQSRSSRRCFAFTTTALTATTPAGGFTPGLLPRTAIAGAPARFPSPASTALASITTFPSHPQSGSPPAQSGFILNNCDNGQDQRTQAPTSICSSLNTARAGVNTGDVTVFYSQPATIANQPHSGRRRAHPLLSSRWQLHRLGPLRLERHRTTATRGVRARSQLPA